MKHIYLITFCFFTSLTFAQNDLLGEWFIHYINIDGSQQYSTIEGSNNIIIFEDSSFYGSVCGNGHGGTYIFNSNYTINITDFAALAGDCFNLTETNLFLYPYQFDFLNYFVIDPVYSYTISGSGANEILTLTNANNDFVVYGRSQFGPQDEALVGQWYLDYVVVDDQTHENYYNENQNMDIIFTSDVSSSPDNFMYEGSSSCNFYGGDYSANSNTITLNSMAITLIDCIATPRGIYEDLYLDILGGNISLPNILNYTISGPSDDETLTIINPDTGDSAVYGKTPISEVLVQTWYLSRIEIPGNPTIEIPINAEASLTLTNNLSPLFFETQALGSGNCNDFMANYQISFNTSTNIQFTEFGQTLIDCSPSYEDQYFAILGNPTTNFFEIDILNDGTSLRLTDLLGASLVFGDERLSTSENELNTFGIQLKENPVVSILELSSSEGLPNATYTIRTIQGKVIENTTLLSHQIPVDMLQSGVYFLTIKTAASETKTLRFIKQ